MTSSDRHVRVDRGCRSYLATAVAFELRLERAEKDPSMRLPVRDDWGRSRGVKRVVRLREGTVDVKHEISAWWKDERLDVAFPEIVAEPLDHCSIVPGEGEEDSWSTNRVR